MGLNEYKEQVADAEEKTQQVQQPEHAMCARVTLHKHPGPDTTTEQQDGEKCKKGDQRAI